MASVFVAMNRKHVSQHFLIQCSGFGWGALHGFGGYSPIIAGNIFIVECFSE